MSPFITTVPTAHRMPRELCRGVLIEHARRDRSAADSASPRGFAITSADTFVVRQSANELLKQRYGWRGYHTVSLPSSQTSSRITLTAVEHGDTIGTITVGLDELEGMNCEAAFSDEIDALRANGRRVCEFTKLAVDAERGSKRVLAGLFHVAYIVAHRLRGYNTVVMEVNPRHVRYYQRMLGARVLGSERLNSSVNAPAVLLSIEFDYVAEQISQFGGRHERAEGDRSLYSEFFSPLEEAGILACMMSAQVPTSAAIN